jgi:hypothetical protein
MGHLRAHLASLWRLPAVVRSVAGLRSRIAARWLGELKRPSCSGWAPWQELADGGVPRGCTSSRSAAPRVGIRTVKDPQRTAEIELTSRVEVAGS